MAPSADSLQVSKDWSLEELTSSQNHDEALYVTYKFDGFELASISNYRRFEAFRGSDVEAGPTNLQNFIADSDQDSISQEVRLSGGDQAFQWVGGLYYLRLETDLSSGWKYPAHSIAAPAANFQATGLDQYNRARLLKQSVSAFGQVDYEFIPRWTLVLGGRYIDESGKYNFRSDAYVGRDDYDFSDGPPIATLQPSYFDDQADQMWTAKAQIEHRPTDDLLLYLGVNRGVKGAGYNSKLPGGAPLAPSEFRYRPETLLSYESGLKLSAWDGRMTVDASAYYYDYSDYQAFTFAGGSGVVFNRDAHTYGAELSVNVAPIEDLQIGFGVALINATVEDLAVAPGVVRDVKPTFTPDAQAGVQVRYTLPFTLAGGALRLAGDASWRDDVYGNIRNFDADVTPGYSLFNLRSSWTSPDERWLFTAALDNVFDERYETVTFNLATLCGCHEVSYGMPRLWSASVRYSW